MCKKSFYRFKFNELSHNVTFEKLSITYLIVVCPHYWFAIENPGRDQCPFGGVCCYRRDSQVHPEVAEDECKAAGGRFHNKPRLGDNRYVCEMGQGTFTK